MSAADQRMVAAHNPGRLEPGMVLVADKLRRPGRPAIACSANAVVVGELRRRGVSTVRGPLDLDVTDGHTRAADADAVAWAAVLPAGDGHVGLGVAAADEDRT